MVDTNRRIDEQCSPMKLKNPNPALIRKTRLTLGHTQAEAAVLVHSSTRAWQFWEAGTRSMPVALWELFLIKIGAHPRFGALP